MHRFVVLAAAVGIMAGSFTIAQAQEDPVPHGHLMVTGIEFDAVGDPVAFKKCRLLANGRPVPNHAHHDKLHVGDVGEVLWTNARAAVVPLYPLAQWETCEEFEQMIFSE